MWKSIKRRFQWAWRILIHPSWRWLVVLPLALLGIFQSIREELPLFVQSKLQLFDKLPSWWTWHIWVILFLIIATLIVIESSYRIYRNTQKEQDQSKKEIVGGIENDISSGKELLEKLKQRDRIDNYDLEDYNNWINRVGTMMQKEQYQEFAAWFAATYTRDKTLAGLIKSCEQGINQLLDIHKRLLNSSNSHN